MEFARRAQATVMDLENSRAGDSRGDTYTLPENRSREDALGTEFPGMMFFVAEETRKFRDVFFAGEPKAVERTSRIGRVI